MKTFGIVLFLVLLSSAMLLPGLDYGCLLQDEALTAILAENTLKWGFPCVFDGLNVLWNNPVNEDLNSPFFSLQGWLPFYVNAFVFCFSGISTFWARFSSAMAGCVFFAFMFFSVRRITGSGRASLWAVLSMLFCVPLLLHFRQCHYHGFGILFTWGLFHFFLLGSNFLRNTAFYFFSLALVNTGLYEWGTLMVSFTLSALVIRDKRSERLKMMALNLLFCAPFLYLYPIGNFFIFRNSLNFPEGGSGIPEKIIFYFSQVEASLLPLGLMIILLVFSAIFWSRMKEMEQSSLVTGLLVSFVSIFLTAFLMPFTCFRNIIMIIPLLETVLIIGIWHSLRFSKRLGVVFLLLSFFFQFAEFRKDSQGKYFSSLIPYLYELLNPREDPHLRLCRYLKQNAEKTDTVFCFSEEYPLMFYTSLAVRGGESKIGVFSDDLRGKRYGIEKVQQPEWLVLRQGQEFLYPKDYLKNLVSGAVYEEIPLSVEDGSSGPPPCPFPHYSISPAVEKPLMLYKKMKSPEKTD